MSELVAAQVVEEEVGRGVDADQKVGQADDHDHRGVQVALLPVRGLLRAPDQLVEIGNDLEALADDEKG